MLVTHELTPTILETVCKRPGFYILHGPEAIGKKTALLEYLPVQATHIIQPGESGNIKVADIREAVAPFNLKMQDHWHLVVDQAETMTEYSQNSLLKVLEELPYKVSVFMVASDLQRLLPTVRSRAQIYALPAPTYAQVEDWVMDSLYESEYREQLLKLTGAKPGLLAGICADADYRSRFEAAASDIERLLESSRESDRMAAAVALTQHMPDIMPRIVSYVRWSVRQSPTVFWQRLALSCEYAQRLTVVNVNRKLILDVIALRLQP